MDRIERLCAWFGREARDLPWRRPAKRRKWGAWGALVAETMLQQTQVSRVVDRFEQMMRRFPNPASMAGADAQHVLTLWQGMGYYRRARNLHAAAGVICARFEGRVPRDFDDLISLPGVGRYTAGAIASIMFDEPRPIVDGNVRRVLARWDAKSSPRAERRADAWTWSRAQALVEMSAHRSPSFPGRGRGGGPSVQTARPNRNQSRSLSSPSVFNEALMELGATICTPRQPQCHRCPVGPLCLAHQHGSQHRIPAPQKASQRSRVHHHAVVITHNGKLLLEQRPDRGMWASMWQVPTIETDRVLSISQLQRRLRSSASSSEGLAPPLPAMTLQRLMSFEHDTTHRRIQFHVFRAVAASKGRPRDPAQPTSAQRWRRPRNVIDCPMSTPQASLIRAACSDGFTEQGKGGDRRAADRGPVTRRQ